jgi:hypothetical protein
LSSQADGPLNSELLAFEERVRKLVEAISVIDEGAR